MTPELQHCDWCGEPFAVDEKPVEGYENRPTHRKCRRFAVRAWRQRQGHEDFDPYRLEEREPFVDWPNGQGVDD